MENQKISKIAEVMQKAEKLVVEEVKGKPEDQLIVAAGLMAVTRNLYIQTLILRLTNMVSQRFTKYRR